MSLGFAIPRSSSSAHSKKSWEYIRKILEENLGNEFASAKLMNEVVDFINENKIEELDFSNLWPPSNLFFGCLAKALQQTPSVKKIILRGNHISSKEAIAFSEHLMGTMITEIDLSENHIEDSGALVVIKNLASTHVTKLALFDHWISDKQKDIDAIAQVFNESKLDVLKIYTLSLHQLFSVGLLTELSLILDASHKRFTESTSGYKLAKLMACLSCINFSDAQCAKLELKSAPLSRKDEIYSLTALFLGLPYEIKIKILGYVFPGTRPEQNIHAYIERVANRYPHGISEDKIAILPLCDAELLEEGFSIDELPPMSESALYVPNYDEASYKHEKEEAEETIDAVVSASATKRPRLGKSEEGEE